VAVTRSLYAAVKTIFLGDAKKAFWVDAICINQMDVHEVNEQVRKMSSIYENAIGVIPWLGIEGDDSKAAFELLRTFKREDVGKCMYEIDGP
jgi:hypothetical protein